MAISRYIKAAVGPTMKGVSVRVRGKRVKVKHYIFPALKT